MPQKNVLIERIWTDVTVEPKVGQLMLNEG